MKKLELLFIFLLAVSCLGTETNKTGDTAEEDCDDKVEKIETVEEITEDTTAEKLFSNDDAGCELGEE